VDVDKGGNSAANARARVPSNISLPMQQLSKNNRKACVSEAMVQTQCQLLENTLSCPAAFSLAKRAVITMRLTKTKISEEMQVVFLLTTLHNYANKIKLRIKY
jgi:hypothetical protein